MVVIMLAAQACGTAIICTAGDFAAGDTATVMCYFPDDIVNHAGVYIQYFPINAPNGSQAKDVLVCTAEDVTSSRCHGQDGYELKSHTRNTISVDIFNVTMKAAGQYFCQFLPHDGSPRDTCKLTVHGRVTPIAVDNPHTTNVDEKQSLPKGGTEAVSVGVILGVVCSVLVLLVCVAAVMIVYCRKLLLERSTRTTRDENCEIRGEVSSRPQNIYTDGERSKEVTVPATVDDEGNVVLYLPRLYEVMDRVEKRLGSVESLPACCSSIEATPSILQTKEDILRRLFPEIHDSETQLKRESETQTDSASPLLSTL